jgi:CBS domain-containing protein
MVLIEPYLQRKMVILHSHVLVRLAARAIEEQNVGCVLVCNDKGQLIGIATDRDLACSLAFGRGASEAALSEVMTPHPVTIAETTEVEQVIQTMEDSRVRRLPAMKKMSSSGGTKCVGIITLDDLIGFKLIDSDRLARIIRSQIRRDWTPHSRPHV